MKRNILISCLTISFFLSCSKSSSDNVQKKDMLVAQAWVIVKVEERVGTNPYLDVFQFEPDCKKDDKWIFKADFSLEYNESANACSGSTPNSIQDVVTWAFADDEKKLVIENISFNIEGLTNVDLIISTSEDIGGVTYWTKITFKH